MEKENASISEIVEIWLDNTTLISVIRRIFQLVLLLIGIIGSAITYLVVMRKRHMQTPLYVLLVSLAVADLVYCVVDLTFELSLHTSWKFGKVLCFMDTFLMELPDSYTIIAMSMSICLFTCHKPNLKTVYITICIAAFCATIFVLPNHLVTELRTVGRTETCVVSYEHEILSVVFLVLACVIKVGLPLVVILFCSCLKFVVGIDRSNSSSRLLLTLMIIYILLVTTAIVCVIVCIFQFDAISPYLIVFMFSLAPLINVYKPFVYYKMDPVFRNEILDLVSRCFKINRPSPYNLQVG